jgi:hypothetical protein
MQRSSQLQLQQLQRLTHTQPSSSSLPKQAAAPWQLCWQPQLLLCLALRLWRRQQVHPKQQQQWFSRPIRGWRRLARRRKQLQQQRQELTVLLQVVTAMHLRGNKPRAQATKSSRTGTAMLLQRLLIKAARVQTRQLQMTLGGRTQQQQQQQRQQWILLLQLLRAGCRCNSTSSRSVQSN